MPDVFVTGDAVAGGLPCAYHLIETPHSVSGCCRTDELRGKATAVAPSQSQLLQLMCDALARGIIMQGGRPHGEVSSPYNRPLKRQKVMMQGVLCYLCLSMHS